MYILYTDKGQAGSGLTLSVSLAHTHTCRSELWIDLHHFWQWYISELTRCDSISTQLNSFPFNYCLSLIPNVSQIRVEINMLGKPQSELRLWLKCSCETFIVPFICSHWLPHATQLTFGVFMMFMLLLDFSSWCWYTADIYSNTIKWWQDKTAKMKCQI